MYPGCGFNISIWLLLSLIIGVMGGCYNLLFMTHGLFMFSMCFLVACSHLKSAGTLDIFDLDDEQQQARSDFVQAPPLPLNYAVSVQGSISIEKCEREESRANVPRKSRLSSKLSQVVCPFS